MPLHTAQKFAWSLARALMTIILLVKTESGFTVVTADEWDGDPEQVVREYDPFAR